MVLRRKSGTDRIDDIRNRWKGATGHYSFIAYDSGFKIIDENGEKVAWINGGADSGRIADLFVTAGEDISHLMEVLDTLISEAERLELYHSDEASAKLAAEREKAKAVRYFKERNSFKTQLGRTSKKVNILENKLRERSGDCVVLRRKIGTLETKLRKMSLRLDSWREKYESERIKPRFVADCNLPGGNGLSGRRGERRCNQ